MQAPPHTANTKLMAKCWLVLINAWACAVHIDPKLLVIFGEFYSLEQGGQLEFSMLLLPVTYMPFSRPTSPW